VTCYMRHMDWLFDELGIESDKLNRRRVDTALRALLGSAEGDHCPEVWAAYKALDDEERAALVPGVRETLGL
jgi:hypothetical protein